MRKPSELRDLLEKSVPELKRNPERLLVFIDAGKVISTAVQGLSFMYTYTLNLIITDFAGDEDAIIVPLLAWLRVNQPDHFLNEASQAEGISFEVDLINNKAIDLSIRIQLTESVRVAIDEKPNKPGDYLATITHLNEPPLVEDRPDITHWQLIIDGSTVAEWDTPHPFKVD